MPFGLSGAPATFTSLINRVLDGVIGDFVLVYYDDIIIRSDDFESNLHDIRLVMERLNNANLIIYFGKSSLA